MLDRVKIRSLTLPLQNISLLPSETPGLLLLYVLGHRPFVLWSIVQSTLAFDWILKSIYIPYTSEFFRLLLSSLTLLNTSNAVPLEAKFMPTHCTPTCLHNITYIPKRPFMCPLHIQSWLSWKQVNRVTFYFWFINSQSRLCCVVWLSLLTS